MIDGDGRKFIIDLERRQFNSSNFGVSQEDSKRDNLFGLITEREHVGQKSVLGVFFIEIIIRDQFNKEIGFIRRLHISKSETFIRREVFLLSKSVFEMK